MDCQTIAHLVVEVGVLLNNVAYCVVPAVLLCLFIARPIHLPGCGGLLFVRPLCDCLRFSRALWCLTILGGLVSLSLCLAIHLGGVDQNVCGAGPRFFAGAEAQGHHVEPGEVDCQQVRCASCAGILHNGILNNNI